MRQSNFTLCRGRKKQTRSTSCCIISQHTITDSIRSSHTLIRPDKTKDLLGQREKDIQPEKEKSLHERPPQNQLLLWAKTKVLGGQVHNVCMSLESIKIEYSSQRTNTFRENHLTLHLPSSNGGFSASDESKRKGEKLKDAERGTWWKYGQLSDVHLKESHSLLQTGCWIQRLWGRTRTS